MNRLDCDRTFVAVMEAGSFAKAAERLGTSSGQASKMVAKLERDLKARLLNRTTRAIAATEAGRAYFERIRLILGELDALDDEVKSRDGAIAGRLKLTAPLSFSAAQLTPALLDFAALHPALNLDVSYTDRVVNLIDEGFDAGVRIGSLPDSTLVARKLCEARIVLAASRDYLDRHQPVARPEDLARHDCIIDTNFRDPLLWRFHDAEEDEAISVAVSGRHRFSSPEACLAAAEKGLGIARVPSFMAGPRLKARRLVPVLPHFEEKRIAIYAIYPPGRHLARKVRALVDFLAERFAGEPEWDQGWG